MKQSIIKTTIFLFVLVGFTGCKKFLDIKPKGFTIPEYYDDYLRLLEHTNQNKAAERYPELLTDNAQYSGGDSILNFKSLLEENQRLFSFQHGAVFADGVTDYYWEDTYKRIYTFNTIINNVMNVTDVPEQKKKSLRAEALVNRAYEYFSLLIGYAKAYDPNSAATDLGVPIILSEDVAKTYTRNTVKEVYDQIEADLNEAIPNLPDAVPHSFRPNKNVGYSFRARMLLYKGEYDLALTNVKTALGLSSYIIDLKQYQAVPNVTIDRIRKLPALTEPFPNGKDNPENIFAKYGLSAFGWNNNIFASGDLLSTYDKDLVSGQVDFRRSLWFSDNLFRTSSFPGRTLWVRYFRDNLGLSTIENILTAAECYARIGGAANLTEASNLYNLLRRNRISNYTDITLTAANALTKILDERRREFPFTGPSRLADLKRLNRDPQTAKTVTHVVDGQTYTLPPNDPRYILPVPPKVLSYNPSIPDGQR